MAEKIVANTCLGAPIVRGDEPPLKTGIPITIYHDDYNKPVAVRGCPMLVDGKCVASSPVPPELAPNCFYVPAKPKSPVVSAPVKAVTPVEEQEYEAVEDSFPQPGYLITSSDAHFMMTSPEELGKMVEAEQGFKDTVNKLLEEYAAYIKGLGKKPTFKARLRDKVDEDYDHSAPVAYAIGVFEAAVDRGGVTIETQTKLLKNHYPEKFTFKYTYGENAEMSKVAISFPNGGMDITFEGGRISEISFALSNVIPTLALHEREKTVLAKRIMSYGNSSSVPPRGASFEFSFGEKYAITIKTDNGYEHLYYAPPYNKLVKKEDIEGKGGMETLEFAAILYNVLSMLPFARFDPSIMPQA